MSLPDWRNSDLVDDPRVKLRIPFESLVHACIDSWSFVVGLKNGQIIRFFHAEITDQGTVILYQENDGLIEVGGEKYDNRGVEVLISEIAWCCEADS